MDTNSPRRPRRNDLSSSMLILVVLARRQTATVTEPQDQLSADLSAYPFAHGPQNHGPIIGVRDVLICSTVDVVLTDDDLTRPPVANQWPSRTEVDGSPVDLGRGVRIDRLSNEEKELVMNACAPRGHYFLPVRQFGQRYTYIRDLEDHEDQVGWDRDGILGDVLLAARLVRDNNHSPEWAARITDYDDGRCMIVPAYGRTRAYRLRRTRDWLDAGEAAELQALLAAYWAVDGSLPRRVAAASWRTEYATWSAWADAALPTIVSGLEALLKTERRGATRQFKTRVPPLAEELAIDGVTPADCEDLYDARSEWVHGAHVRLFSSDDAPDEGGTTAAQRDAIARIARLQDVLRVAVRRAFEDEAFRAVFANDDTIRERWARTDL